MLSLSRWGIYVDSLSVGGGGMLTFYLLVGEVC